MKKALLLVLCLAMLLLLCACSFHIDSDPWPASPNYTAPEATAVPGQDPLSSPTQPPATDEVVPGLNG